MYRARDKDLIHPGAVQAGEEISDKGGNVQAFQYNSFAIHCGPRYSAALTR
jgi:hypothetical protein